MSRFYFLANNVINKLNIISSWSVNRALSSRKVELNSIKVTGFTNSFNHANWGVRCYSNCLNIQNQKSIINNNNIFKSFVPCVDGFQGLLLHQCIWKNIDKWWNKTALINAVTGKSYTYRELKKLSGKFATSLRKNNLRPGDTIAVVLTNVPEYAIVVLGASEAGVCATLINPAYTAEEIKKQLENSEAAAVVTLTSNYPIVAESIKGNSVIRLPIIVIEERTDSPTPENSINFKDLIGDGVEEFEKTGLQTERNPETDTVFLPYSSGTTGLPKGVELTHRNVVANMFQERVKEVTASREAIGDHQEILPVFLPMYHIFGLVVCMLNYLGLGGKVICMPSFSSTALLEVMNKHKITSMYVAPPIVQMLANDDRFTKRHIESIKLITCGAAPTGEEVIAKFLNRVGTQVNFAQGYGLTETSPVISKSVSAPLESSGILVPNTEVRIVGHEEHNRGNNLGVDETGEIFVRGPQVMKGYFKNPKATADTMEGDWFKTGDLGSFDDKGHLYIRGRLKELIKVQGYQVAPSELEDIIQGHEKIADAAVIGVLHERYGEIPKAFIVPKANMLIDGQEIKDYVAKRVAKYKQLGHVVIIDKIPKSAAGKILRRELQKI
ncbi:4-coumarate--CoA ligase 2-like [Cotesia glomerata]|uniref:Luciferin 4-monooxygenase n=1 Tax=Cotesia glomerata TaxID=32391 RepID=A0AAV7I028_COTGL|nr:4-coumarate--CoA ligase 2-like [Cotesia glomerata]KAH0537703.1 hypothetical protein KQX54_000893 [Cotesia glomerata]